MMRVNACECHLPLIVAPELDLRLGLSRLHLEGGRERASWKGRRQRQMQVIQRHALECNELGEKVRNDVCVCGLCVHACNL